ncbi:MAG: hypothetical protein JST89_13965 [Cyanobacteria bacterium SZAS-4]|nr:hypothetical protein [Cyanobacteria bacterium SZAS-4]
MVGLIWSPGNSAWACPGHYLGDAELSGPRRAAAYDEQAQMWLKVGQNRLAVEALSAAILLSPQDASLLSERARVRTTMMDYMEALDDYNQAVQLNPFGADLYEFSSLQNWVRGFIGGIDVSGCTGCSGGTSDAIMLKVSR